MQCRVTLDLGPHTHKKYDQQTGRKPKTVGREHSRADAAVELSRGNIVDYQIQRTLLFKEIETESTHSCIL